MSEVGLLVFVALSFGASDNNNMKTQRPVLDNYVSSHKKNCTVIALATTANIPYNVAYQIATEAGRPDNKGFQSCKLIKYFNKKCAPNRFRKSKRCPITVQKFCKKYPVGRFFVRKRGHAYAVVDGVAIDLSNIKPLERILEAWQFIGDVSSQQD